MAISLNKPISFGKGKKNTNGGTSAKGKGQKGKMPTKRSINLILIDEKAMNWKVAIPAIIIIVVLAGVFGKFMVYDKVVALSEAEGRVASLQSQLARANREIDSYTNVKDAYAHYTYSGMTEEELSRVDRVEVLRLVAKLFYSADTAKSWGLTGNTLTIEVNGSSLEELNHLAERVEEEDIVDRCVITNATKKRDEYPLEEVKASFIIYLQQPAEEEKE